MRPRCHNGAVMVLLLVSAVTGHAATDESELEKALQGFPGTGTNTGESSLDTILHGFDNVPGGETASDSAINSDYDSPHDNPWQISGYGIISAAYNYAHDAPATGATDYRGWSRLRAKLSPELSYQAQDNTWRFFANAGFSYDAIYDIRGRDHYTDEVVDSYARESELREAYLQVSPVAALDITIGRQILAWGKSDNIRIVDLLNPMDNREPGMVDIEDLRIPLLMTRADYFFQQWRLTGAVIHELRFDRNPPYGSDFYPYTTPPPPEQRPDNDTRNWEYAFAASGTFTGWDISAHWTRLFDDQPHATFSSGAGVMLRHSRLTVLGLTADWALGNWLLKTELARINGLRFFAEAGPYSRWDMMAGTDYSGFRDATLSLEIAYRHLNDYDNTLANPVDQAQENSLQSMLRFQESYQHEQLNLLLLWGLFGDHGEEGGFSRASLSYELAPGTSWSVGVVTYQGGDSALFRAVADNDRIFSELRRDF